MYIHFEILIGPHGILKWTHEIFDKNKLNRHTNIHFQMFDRTIWSSKWAHEHTFWDF